MATPHGRRTSWQYITVSPQCQPLICANRCRSICQPKCRFFCSFFCRIGCRFRCNFSVYHTSNQKSSTGAAVQMRKVQKHQGQGALRRCQYQYTIGACRSQEPWQGWAGATQLKTGLETPWNILENKTWHGWPPGVNWTRQAAGRRQTNFRFFSASTKNHKKINDLENSKKINNLARRFFSLKF